MFRDLKADEIECKISQITENGLSLLLYKTARTDMQILDETVTPYNWQCEYKEVKNNMYCGIAIYDTSKKEWITKWDCGVESAFGDKEKGEASDAFKRAGFKWGIGIELYTAPFIWIKSDMCNIKQDKGKLICRDKFIVSNIEIKNKEIVKLTIADLNTKKYVFVYSKGEIKDATNRSSE
jgi:hypothetical protein